MQESMGWGALLLQINAPVHALPVDVFRVLAGLVGLAYFARILYDVPDLSSEDGLIDHGLCRRVFPPTRLSLFRPGIPTPVLRGVYACACLASLALAVGFHPRIAAAGLFVIAVSAYRWNLFAVYVDDAIAHLLFFWVMLLPVGRTLTLEQWHTNGYRFDPAWTEIVLPGAPVRAFLANMALVYLVAGLYKFTSPMWRNGTALAAILRLPVARFPDVWKPRHSALLRAGNAWALVMEPLFAFMFISPVHSPLKWFLALSAAAFHVGIILTLKIPFANLAMLGAIPVAMGPEMMLMGWGIAPPPVAETGPLGWNGIVGIALVALLTSMVLWELARSRGLSKLPLWKTHMSGFFGNPICVLLWLMGIAQSYRLFDWIDSRNYHVRYEVRAWAAQGSAEPETVDPKELFPGSLRHVLLQSYIFGNVWLQLTPEQRAQVRESLLHRHAQRFARRHPGFRAVEVFAVTQRVTSDNLDLTSGQRSLLMRFDCLDGRAAVRHEARTA
ncbi:MAG: hypothetical protein HKN72_09135 [Gemmatimonadetes bacterium]|nr:hypothetical protein [Gemmatimonadota bacterium]NNF13375.1 hypothetical protein [Gemmatimonadota bacterium]